MHRKRNRILVLCATRRGVAFIRRIHELHPEDDYTVVSFQGESWEPDYMPELEAAVAGAGARLVIAKRVELTTLFADGIFDLLFAVSWRYLVSREVWSRAKLGAYVFHDSLLPRYRGFSPTVWAMINGETATGVSLIEMADAVDAGLLIEQERVEIGRDEYIASVMERVTQAYLRVLERTLPALLAGTARRTIQNEAEASYVCKRLPADNRINWSDPAVRVYNHIRACAAPYPGAFCFAGDRCVRVWFCEPPAVSPVYAGRVPGRVVEIVPGKGVRVLAGDHSLLLVEVQFEGAPVTRADLVFSSLATTLS